VVKLYNIKSKREITTGRLPLWNFINFSIFPYDPSGLKKLAEAVGVTLGEKGYYIQVGTGLTTRLFGGAGYGTLVQEANEFWFTDNNVAWKVPYAEIKSIKYDAREGAKALLKQPELVIEFEHGNKIYTYHFSVPNMATGVNIPLESNISREATEGLYNLLKSKLI